MKQVKYRKIEECFENGTIITREILINNVSIYKEPFFPSGNIRWKRYAFLDEKNDDNFFWLSVKYNEQGEVVKVNLYHGNHLSLRERWNRLDKLTLLIKYGISIPTDVMSINKWWIL